MEGVVIPTYVLLEAMMKQIRLPPPIYMTRSVEEGQIVARVVFYPSTECFLDSLQPQSLSSCPSNSTELAVEDAALQGIRYMETVQKKVIKDFRSTEMETSKKQNELLLQELKQKDEKIEEFAKQLNKLTKSHSDSINSECDLSSRIYKTASDDIAPKSNADLHIHDATLIGIEDIAFDLKNLTFKSTEKLETKSTDYGTLSYFAEDDHVTACYGSNEDPTEPWKSEAYDYDSDGLPLDYYGSQYDSDY